ncbi:MAG: 2-oxoglutarate and iron-dependent oxygenase domain-containing protein [Acidobacteriota bacterium]|nr:2-oxoglutarate and iron-dependent oxygenase domain-containing protein [Acidobacteriota bacterium]
MQTEQERGIQALNRDYARFDQVDKRQAYHLAENEEDRYDEDFCIRVCDMSRYWSGNSVDQALFARELGEGMEEIGFAVITGHGIDPGIYPRTRDKVAAFFETTTFEQRLPFTDRGRKP